MRGGLKERDRLAGRAGWLVVIRAAAGSNSSPCHVLMCTAWSCRALSGLPEVKESQPRAREGRVTEIHLHAVYPDGTCV